MRSNLRRVVRRCQTVIAALCGAATLSVRSFAVAVAGAQTMPTATSAAPLRLGDLYAQVRGDNARLVAAQALVRAARARIPGAKRPPDPQFQFGLMNYSLPTLRQMAPLGMTQFQVMQMLPLGGKLGLAGRIADAQANATAERAEDAGWDLRAKSAMTFYDLYASDRQLDVARETLRLLQDIARTAESMYRVGEGRQTDVLRAQVEIAKMAEDTLRMQAMRRTMVARLNGLLNRDTYSEPPEVVRPIFPEAMPARAWLDSISSSSRPMIRAAMQDVRAGESAAALARRDIIPDLQVGVQFARGTITMTNAWGMTSTRPENMVSMMIGASIPVFARDRQYQMRNEANAMKEMAEADVTAMRAETRGRIGEVYADLTRARQLSRLYHTTVLPQAEATVSSALSSYRVGKVDFMTLLDDQMTVNRYRQELLGLEADEGRAWAELEMLTGRELIDSHSTAAASGTAKRGGR